MSARTRDAGSDGGAPAAPAPPVTAVAEDYLKAVWSAQEWDDAPVTTTGLAARLGLAPSTVSEQVRRLVDAGLVVPAPYRPVELTAAGRGHALRVVRRHRLIETYLVEQLGYGWDQVHEEAEVLEHAVSDLFLERVDALLGSPRRDPHGDPIPAADGSYQRPDAELLATCGTGRSVRVVRISDADPAVLRHLADSGVVLDAVLDVVRGASDGTSGGTSDRASGAAAVLVELDGRSVELAADAAGAVRVVPAAPVPVSPVP